MDSASIVSNRPAENALPLALQLEALSDLTALEIGWRALEADADGSFFTSWLWIGTWLRWLRQWAPETQLRQLRVSRGEQTVALAVFATDVARRWGRRERRLHLHCSGHAALDSLHIEFNGLLIRREEEAAVTQCVATALRSGELDCDLLVLPGLQAASRWTDAAAAAGLLVDSQEQDAPGVDFEVLRAQGRHFGELPDRKERHALRRAAADYTRLLGPVACSEPQDLAEAQLWLETLAGLHQRYWQRKGGVGAFGSEAFVDFHRQLLAAGFPLRHVRLFRIAAGEHTVGFVHALEHRRVIAFYQSGFNYDLLPTHNQPGWLCISEVLARLDAEGARSFEFLAGPSAYKRRYANVVRSLGWLRVQPASPVAHLYSGLRQLRRALRDGLRRSRVAA